MKSALAFATLAVSLISPIAALVVPRATPPAGYDITRLENYDTYHTRYMALGCQNKHDSPFFDTCCRPLAAGQKLSSRPAECNPDSEEYDDCEDDDDTTTVPAPESKPTTTTPAVVKSTPKPNSTPSNTNTNNAAAVNKGGFATFFYQNGVAGACGKVNSDGALIAAMDYRRYGNLSVRSPLCGKQVQIRNPANGKSVIVTVADACPTCNNANSIDLSVGAFQRIAALPQGLVPIEWNFV